jgi:hypothetical protein
MIQANSRRTWRSFLYHRRTLSRISFQALKTPTQEPGISADAGLLCWCGTANSYLRFFLPFVTSIVTRSTALSPVESVAR